MEKKPNDKFREVRERTQSLDNSEYFLSRQELADQANTWIWEHRNEKFDLNANYIGKIVQGVICWPRVLPREAFRAIFHVSKDSELGFVNVRARYYRVVVKLNDVDNVKRRKLFETTTLSMGALALGRPRAALRGEIARTPIPARVGASDIEQIRGATQVACWRPPARSRCAPSCSPQSALSPRPPGTRPWSAPRGAVVSGWR